MAPSPKIENNDIDRYRNIINISNIPFRDIPTVPRNQKFMIMWLKLSDQEIESLLKYYECDTTETEKKIIQTICSTLSGLLVFFEEKEKDKIIKVLAIKTYIDLIGFSRSFQK